MKKTKTDSIQEKNEEMEVITEDVEKDYAEIEIEQEQEERPEETTTETKSVISQEKIEKPEVDKKPIEKPKSESKPNTSVSEQNKPEEKEESQQASSRISQEVKKIEDNQEIVEDKPNEEKKEEIVEEDKSKRNPGDFGLWFTVSKFANQDMKWDSPWGIGYPGWHIECSGLSAEYLGEYLDIHCGGVDNIFPHHTNEIAQSEAYFGHKWCNYWVHGEHLNDKSGKMSKSNGEFLTVSLLEEKGYSPLAYRYFCLNSHYRNQLVFSWEALDGAEQAYQKLKNKIKGLDRTPDLHESKLDYYQNLFKEAISNDLNTSSMMTVLYDVLKDEELSDFTKLYLVDDFDKVLSLGLIDEVKEIDEDLEKYILEKIEERNEAKKTKDYQKADQIRNELLEKNIKLIDSRDGTTYELI